MIVYWFIDSVTNGLELLVPKLLDDEEFDFDLPVSPIDSAQWVLCSDSIFTSHDKIAITIRVAVTEDNICSTHVP